MNLVNILTDAADVSCTITEGSDAIVIPGQIAHIIALAVTLIQIFVPILLIIWGMLDLGKAVMAQKDDEIKKGQQTFVKRIVAAAVVFFVVVIVRLVVSLVAGGNGTGITACINAILDS